MKYNITLNFIPLENSNFTFKIFRKEALTEEKLWKDSIRKYQIDDVLYWVSFTPFENAEEVEVCSLHIPIGLVKLYLYFLFKNKLKGLNISIVEKKKRFNSNRTYINLKTVNSKNGQEIGQKTVWIEPYCLHIANNKQFGFLLDYKFLRNKDYPFNREVQKLSFSIDDNYRQNINFHIDKNRVIQFFIKNYIFKTKQLSNNLKIGNELKKITSNTLDSKVYLFKNKQKSSSQFNGITQYGAFENVNNEPHYFYIFKEEGKFAGRELTQALNGNSFNTFKGLSAVLGLSNQNKSNTEAIIIDDFSKTEVDKILEVVKDSDEKNPIIIAVTPQKEEHFYYQLKHRCLQENIPVQTVHTETIKHSNTLKWSIGSIAVQIFSKLGGVPWIVEPSHKNCLIVGIGQAHKYNREEKKFERFFSYSVLIDSSGKFISIKQLADETDKIKFIEGIAKSVVDIVSEHKNYSKIIFHIPQKLNKNEIKTIESTLEKQDSDIELSIIKINDKSDFIGFNFDKNSLVPYESSYVQISDNQYLIWTEGLGYHNSKVVKRYGNPLHINFYYSNKKENFKNHKVYLQDIINLSGTNYRGFNAKSLPVSSFYPKLIADFSKHFKELNLDLTTKDTEKPWFL